MVRPWPDWPHRFLRPCDGDDDGDGGGDDDYEYDDG